MTKPEHQKDVIRTAAELTEALTDMSARLDAVTAREEKTRRLTWRSIVAIGVDLILSVVTVVALVNAHSNAVSVSELHGNTVTVCQNGNMRLAEQKRLWDYLLLRSKPPKHATAAEKAHERALLAQIQAHVNRTYAPRNCSALYKLGR